MADENLRQLASQALEKHEIKPESLFLFHLFGFEFSYDDERETCTIRAKLNETMMNPFGILHGGLVTYMADSAMGHLCARYVEGTFVTLELKTQFFRAAHKDGQTIIAEASFRKKGRTVLFIDCNVTTEDGKALANMSSTYFISAKHSS